MQIMVDTDLLIEGLLNDNEAAKSASKLIEVFKLGQVQGYITEIGLEKIRFFVNELNDSGSTNQILSTLEKTFHICSIASQVLKRAISLGIRDIDSAVEVACAIDMNLSAIVTHNPQNFAGATLAGATLLVLSVDELLERQSTENINAQSSVNKSDRKICSPIWQKYSSSKSIQPTQSSSQKLHLPKLDVLNPNKQWSPVGCITQQLNFPSKLIYSQSPKQSDQNLRASARRKAKQGNYTEAIALLTQLIYRNSNNAIDYSNRGVIYFQTGQLEKALADYNKALQLNPELDSAYNNRANYYASVGKLAEALSDYEQALDLNPGNTRTWINQAITFLELGLYDLALENLDMALMLGGLESYIYAHRGRTYHLRGDWNCANADYQRALQALSQSDTSGSRLRQQVETWMNQLLKQLSA